MSAYNLLPNAPATNTYNKVQRRVEPALDGGKVHVKGKLVAEQAEHLILGSPVHEVEATANVCAVVVPGDELERQRVAAGGGAVRLGVVRALERALCGAVGRRPARVGPPVAVVAVLAVGVVQPAPVGVDDHLAVDRRARRLARALFPRHLGVVLGRLRAHLLRRRAAHQRPQEDACFGELHVLSFETGEVDESVWWGYVAGAGDLEAGGEGVGMRLSGLESVGYMYLSTALRRHQPSHRGAVPTQ